jgi:uncharacterized protein (TIGR03435 family)
MKAILILAASVVLPLQSVHAETAPSEPPGEHMGMARFTFPGGRFEAGATSLKFLLEWAYSILPAQHSDGPDWMGTDRFDIAAKAAAPATDADMKLMTRTLLAERFHLQFHRETKEVPVIVLSVGKTAPKLLPAKDGEKTSIRMEPRMGADRKVMSWHIVATRFSLEQLNETFSRRLERVIVNRTGMEGDFDFTLDLTPDENRPNPLDADIIMAAMRDQLGLAVKSQKEAVEFFVIDRAEKPTAN